MVYKWSAGPIYLSLPMCHTGKFLLLFLLFFERFQSDGKYLKKIKADFKVKKKDYISSYVEDIS